DKIQEYLPIGVKLLSQGTIVADSLEDYLNRHSEIEKRCSKNGQRTFITTDSAEDFDNHASIFFGQTVKSEHIDLIR
ncbi:MAG: glutamate racemase, partial [Chitinophagaceae bacterium]